MRPKHPYHQVSVINPGRVGKPTKRKNAKAAPAKSFGHAASRTVHRPEVPEVPHTNIPRQLLDRLRQTYALKYFVETGTNRGHTAALMAGLFTKVWTVELASDRQQAAAKFLSKYSHVVCTAGESPDFLRRLMPQLDQPTLFWLDAHWCGGPKLGPECPLLDELSAVGNLDGRHVILIDDARLFVNPPPYPHDPDDWPALQQVRYAVAGWGANLLVVGDVILIEAAR